MKYIYKTTNNKKPCFCVRIPNYPRKFFKTKIEAETYVKEFEISQRLGLEELLNLSQSEVLDLRHALSILPKGKTLSQAVELLNKQNTIEYPLPEAIENFCKIKENSDLSKVYISNLKTRLSALNEISSSFAKMDVQYLIAFLKSSNFAPKTQKHYITVWSEFFEWAKSRRYIKENPFTELHTSELPKLKKKSIEFASISQILNFFKFAELTYPNCVCRWALIAFGGLRASEALALNAKDINFAEKTIKIRSNISKTGDNWLQQDLPENLWGWLNKYPLVHIEKKTIEHYFYMYNKDVKLPHNALRHSFATYHLSLYRDAPKTSLLMKHRSPSMLWQSYLGGLVAISDAKAYFNILPKLD